MDEERNMNMKNVKKILALLVAILMIAASMSALAVKTDGTDSTVVVSGLTSGDKVNFYHIIKWVGDAEDNVAGWYWTDDFASLGKDALIAAIDDQSPDTYTGFTSELAGDISRIAAGATATATVTATGTSVSYDIDDDSKLGTYIALVTPKDASTVYNPAFVSADWTSGNNDAGMIADSTYYNMSAAKKSTIDLTKTSENASDYNKDNGQTVAVGDVLSFTVETTIPGYGRTFDAPAFKLVDTMTDLKLKTDDIAITVGGATADPDTYDLSATTSGYTLNFKPDYLKTLVAPTSLKIEYKAEVLSAAAVANVDEKENTVTLEYSHDPSTETDGKPGGDKEYKKDKTTHYTFTIDANNLWSGSEKIGESGSEIIKISVDRNGNPIYSEVKTWSNITTTEYEASPLAGCEFELYKVDSTGAKTGDPIATAISDANGRILFENLDEGSYILIEKSAPAGYVRDTTEHTIDIIADTTTESITEYYDQQGTWYPTSTEGDGRKPFTYDYTELNSYQIKFDGAEVASHTFGHEAGETEIKWSNKGSTELPTSIHNTKGVELPSTGGIGTTIFYIGGSILVLAAVILLVTKRRMSAED